MSKAWAVPSVGWYLPSVEQAAATAHPLVHEAAKTNSELAETNSKLVASREKMREEIVKAEALSDEYTAQYSETRKLAEASQFSQAIGLMLRNQQTELPDTERGNPSRSASLGGIKRFEPIDKPK